MKNFWDTYLKEHVESATITFLSAFLLELGATLSHVTWDTITAGIIVALIVAAARAALKVVWVSFKK